MKASISQKRQRQRGNTFLESAIIFPGFMLLLLGAMDFSWGAYAYNFCSYAAQDAARWASVNGSLSSSPATITTVQSYVKAEAIGLLPSNLTITPCWSGDCVTGAPQTNENAPGDVVKVTVAYQISPLSGLGLKQAITVSSTAQYVINH